MFWRSMLPPNCCQIPTSTVFVTVCVLDSAELGNTYLDVYSSAHNINIMFLGGR